MGFSRQEYWSGLPFPSPGDLPDPGIEHRSPTLQADVLPSKPPGKPKRSLKEQRFNYHVCRATDICTVNDRVGWKEYISSFNILGHQQDGREAFCQLWNQTF